MSSDLVKRLREFGVVSWMIMRDEVHAAADRIEALEGEVIELKKLVKILHDDASVSLTGKRAAEARAERLHEALEAFVDPPLKGHEQLAILNARKALEDKQ